MSQLSIYNEPKVSDVVYTPLYVAKYIIDTLKPSGVCLDPCKGDGAFYRFLPAGSHYCELEENRDFFNWNKSVDWVIGNPPYSIFDQFLERAFTVSNNVSFLVPTNKVFQRQIIMERISRYGGISHLMVFGSGQLIGFPFGFSVGNFTFKKGYKGGTQIVMGIKQVNQQLTIEDG